jgi:hypothetical protein
VTGLISFDDKGDIKDGALTLFTTGEDGPISPDSRVLASFTCGLAGIGIAPQRR